MTNNRLKELRLQHGYTLDDIEKKTGIKRGTYSNYENNNTEPKLETWRKLAKFYGVAVPYLQGIDASEFVDKVDQEKLSTLGLFFYDDSTPESKEVIEIKLHESMVNSILYSDKSSALKNMNNYIKFLFKLKDEITAFDDDEFLNDYLINEVAENNWDSTPNSDTATLNNKLIREILERVEKGDKKLRDYIVKNNICNGYSMLDDYLEYKKKNKEDTTEVENCLKKQHEEYKKSWNKFINSGGLE